MKRFLVFLSLGCLLLVPAAGHAQSLKDQVSGQLNAGGAKAGFDTKNTKPPQVIIAEVVKMILGFTGIIFTVLVIYAGYNYLTSNGEEDKVATAQKTLKGAVIGLTETLIAYAITGSIAKRLYNITTGGNTYDTTESSYPPQGFQI